MAYNYRNEDCFNCKVFVPAGTGKWLAKRGELPSRVLCLNCYNKQMAKDKAIRANANKSKKVKAETDKLPRLFD